MLEIEEFILSIGNKESEPEIFHKLCIVNHSQKDMDCKSPDECNFPECYCSCEIWEERSLKTE